MADAIITLSTLPYETQVKLLEELSGEYTTIPLEIDGVVYPIPSKVLDLIEGLNDELIKCRLELSGLSENQE